VEGAPKYLAVYELDKPNIPNSEEWGRARMFGRSSEILPNLVNFHVNMGKLLLALSK